MFTLLMGNSRSCIEMTEVEVVTLYCVYNQQDHDPGPACPEEWLHAGCLHVWRRRVPSSCTAPSTKTPLLYVLGQRFVAAWGRAYFLLLCWYRLIKQ